MTHESGVHDEVEVSCPMGPNVVPDGWHIVERCDSTAKYANDGEAALALGYRGGRWVKCKTGAEHYIVETRRKHCQGEECDTTCDCECAGCIAAMPSGAGHVV